MSKYNINNTIDSIGTETPFSDTNDSVQNNGYYKKYMQKNNSNVLNGGNNDQTGGGFFDYLFGKDTTKTCNMTELIINALEQEKFDVVDFLLSRKFIADPECVGVNGNTILHLLVLNYDKTENIRKATVQIIQNKNYECLLSKANNDGDTPLHIAVKTHNDALTSLLLASGAKKTVNNDGMGVFTDRDTESFVEDDDETAFTIDATDKDLEMLKRGFSGFNLGSERQLGRPVEISILSTTDTDKRPIFSKPQLLSLKPIVVENVGRARDTASRYSDKVADIVAAFRTKTDELPDLAETDKEQDQEHHDLSKIYTADGIKKALFSASDKIKDSQIFKKPQFTNPLKGMTQSLNSDQFVKELAAALADGRASLSDKAGTDMTGGAKKKGKSKSKKSKGKKHKKNIDYSDMSGFDSGKELTRISRAVESQKDKLHAEALNKIKENLDDKNEQVARAIKTILYGEIKEKSPELSGLDKISELLKLINKKKISEVLKNNAKKIKELIELFKEKDKNRLANKKKISRGVETTEYDSSADSSDFSDSDSDS